MTMHVAPAAEPHDLIDAVRGRSLWQDAMARLMRNRAAVAGMIILSVIATACFLGPFFLPHDYAQVFNDAYTAAPSWTHPFGTENNGRDLLVRVLHGGRISLAVGITATLVALVIGVTYGAISGFLGGRVDSIMMRIVDVLYSVPFMFFVIMLMVFFGRNFLLIFAAIGAIEWLDMARIVRGQTLSLKRREFIEAAHATGVRTSSIIRRHIVPNTLGPVIVYMTLTVPRVILLESFLSFLGLGISEPMTSWGVLISEGKQNMQNAWWMLAFPGGFLALTLLSLNFIGDGLRDALDPKDR